VLHRFGFSVTPEESGEMIKFADGKNSGHIDLEDFVSFCRLSDTQVYAPYIRALLGTASHFCEVVVLKNSGHTDLEDIVSFCRLRATPVD